MDKEEKLLAEYKDENSCQNDLDKILEIIPKLNNDGYAKCKLISVATKLHEKIADFRRQNDASFRLKIILSPTETLYFVHLKPTDTLLKLSQTIRESVDFHLLVKNIKNQRTSTTFLPSSLQTLQQCGIQSNDVLLINQPESPSTSTLNNSDNKLVDEQSLITTNFGLYRLKNKNILPKNSIELVLLCSHCNMLDNEFICFEEFDSVKGFAPVYKALDTSRFFLPVSWNKDSSNILVYYKHKSDMKIIYSLLVAYTIPYSGNISIKLSKKYNTTSSSTSSSTSNTTPPPIIISKEKDIFDIIDNKIEVEYIFQNITSYIDLENKLLKNPESLRKKLLSSMKEVLPESAALTLVAVPTSASTSTISVNTLSRGEEEQGQLRGVASTSNNHHYTHPAATVNNPPLTIPPYSPKLFPIALHPSIIPSVGSGDLFPSFMPSLVDLDPNSLGRGQYPRQLPLPGATGNLVGPNHPLFGGTGTINDAYRGPPLLDPNNIMPRPRFDPIVPGPMILEGEPDDIDPSTGVVRRVRQDRERRRIFGEPNPDHFKPPGW